MSAVTWVSGNVVSSFAVGFESVVACMFFVQPLDRTNAKPTIQGVERTNPGELKGRVGSIPGEENVHLSASQSLRHICGHHSVNLHDFLARGLAANQFFLPCISDEFCQNHVRDELK